MPRSCVLFSFRLSHMSKPFNMHSRQLSKRHRLLSNLEKREKDVGRCFASD